MSTIGNMWDRRKNQDYTYIDNIILDYFDMCGVGVLVHKYTGTYPTGYDGGYSDYFSSDTGNTSTSTSLSSDDITSFEDAFFGENVNRKYDEVPYEIKCIYQEVETQYEMAKYGLYVTSDGMYIQIHLNDCLRKLGRKIMAGDVIEMLHKRDDALLGEDTPAVNKFYIIDSVARARDGWSSTWYPHILALKLSTMTNSQEFNDITTENPNGTLSGGSYGGAGANGANGTGSALQDMSDLINEEAAARVKFRFLQTDQFWMLTPDLTGMDSSWIFDGDGNPPPGSISLGSGSSFPENPADGAYFLMIRSDNIYPILYQYSSGEWQYRKTDYRLKWKAANRLLDMFISNEDTITADGVVQPSKQGLSKVISPKATL